jgi:N-acetylneuraminic acid mutarotase
MTGQYICSIILAILCLTSATTAEEGVWTRKADMPTPRGHLSANMVNGKIYVIGGGGITGLDNVAQVDVYDPAEDSWTRKSSDMPTPRRALASCVLNGLIYTISGWVGPSPALETYDPATDTWTRKADIPTPRAFSAASVVDGKIYVIGGIPQGLGYSVIPTVEEYDPATDTWTKKTDMPTPRAVATASVVDGKIYVIGGYGAFSATEVYDPAMDTWTKKADMPTPRMALSNSVVDGKIYAIGGGTEQPLSTMEVYDPATDTWTTAPDMTEARGSLATCAVNGRIYAFGGSPMIGDPWTAFEEGVVEEYDTGTGIPWIRVSQFDPQKGRTTGENPFAILGSNFPPQVSVTIGGKPLTQMEVTGKLITGLTPAGTEGEHDIWLTAPGLDYSIHVGKFFYNLPSNVVVERITPDNGKQAGGDTATISGSGFLPGATVTIGGVEATNTGVISTLISFTVPPGTEGAKDVVVTNPDGQKATLHRGYTYNPFPVIKKVEPRYGGPLRGGTEITITGSNFMEGVVVTIGEKRVQQLDLFSPTELRLETPPGTAGPKPVRVTNPDGQEAMEEDGFSYNRAPRIISISPSAGPLEGGTPITITGERFIRGLDVLIGGTEADVEVALPTRITALTPPSDVGLKDVTVRNPDGQRDTLEDAFTYNTAPVIVRVTPDNGRLAGGTRITIQGGGFQPGAEVRISINQGAYRAASSVEVMSSSIITALTPPGQTGAENVLVLNPDVQIAVLPEGYTYNPMPVITRLIPNHGPSSGGATITIEGTGFLLGARVVIGERPATTMVRDDMTIEAVAPPNPQGVWDVRVINPDIQEVVMPGGFVSVGEVVYNYPNPFHASQGTTFRFVTKDLVLSVTVKIFNLRGRPIGAARQLGSNEVKWCDPDVHAGLYIYILEAELEGGKKRQVKNVMEVME